jgi:hypothetical protein
MRGSNADIEGCGHIPLTLDGAVSLMNRLYSTGAGYDSISDLTRIGLSHEEMRLFMHAGYGGAGRQAEYLASVLASRMPPAGGHGDPYPPETRHGDVG